MNILILTTHFNTGGITSYILTLAEGLTASGHRVFVASSGGNCIEPLERSGARHLTINIRTKSELNPKIYLLLKRLKAFVEENNIDVIHAHTRVTQVAAFFVGRACKVPFISTCHGFFKLRLFRKIFPCWGDGVIAISEQVREHLVKDFGVSENKVKRIHNGINMRKFLAVNDVQKADFRVQFGIDSSPAIGIIARLSDVKGHHVLIDAMPEVIRLFPEALLLIVGEGALRTKLEAQVNNLKLAGRIRFLPIVEKTAEILALLDVFVMPSLQEGLGLSIMEAQATGVPVVASRAGGIPTIVEDGKTGVLVTPGDSEDLAKAIVDLLENKEKAERLALNAKEFIKNNFSSEIMAQETINFYKKIKESYEKNPGC